ncbi:ybaN [Symbiodinium necroappetens]|uniref:YbaN protein n=1 Tax=Symbiodinium necroappetens TaxID=1628268 RepID=A0A813ACA1_9DINO|nr:ybaN [Symbiodinium necroappetens]
MQAASRTLPNARTGASRTPNVRRWTLVGLGVSCVALGAIGAVVPGLPTTVFLIAASWCFTRSCPWLEDRLVRNRFFRPYLRFLDSGEPMPRRVMWTSLSLMWIAIAVSTVLLVVSDASIAVVVCVPLSGVVGTGFIIRLARPAARPRHEIGACCPFNPSRAGSTPG